MQFIPKESIKIKMQLLIISDTVSIKGIESLPQFRDFSIPISLQPNVLDLICFKLSIMLDHII